MMREHSQGQFSVGQSETGAGSPSRGAFRRLLERVMHGRQQTGDPRRGRLMLESLEQRQLLAGDMELLFTDGLPETTSDPAAQSSVASAQTLTVSSQAEGEAAPDLVQFAKDLEAAGVKIFGADWCPACTQQKELFEDGKNDLPFIEVTNPDRSLNSVGISENISQFPTWEFPDGTRAVGVQTLETISQRSGVAIPQGEQPTFEPIGDLTVLNGSPLHVPIDAYDPDGGPLTVTVSVQDPSLLEASVLQGNRSIRIDTTTYGDMVFELFEQRAPEASGRVATLAEEGFYEGIIFHRVIPNFVLQAGDPTGTGTSGSNKGTFDDDFHPELQHNTEGVLSFAKSSDDTNNSQFFITAGPTRHLDFNHSIFGQMVEGFDVRSEIERTQTNSSDKPTNDVEIESIDVFTDTENSVVMLKAKGNATGTTDVTFTVTDQDGNTHNETVTVTVVNDTVNGQPFLNKITPPTTTAINTAATLQLTSTDVEGDAVTYFAQSLSNSANGTVSVDSATGQLTVTPATDFSGTIDVRVGVRPGPNVTGNASTDQDTQTLSFRFEGEGVTAPTGIDLLASSDSGASDTDNVTRTGSLSFLVSGVTSGNTVQLINTGSGNVIGTGVASGSQITLTTNNLAALGDGTYQIAARQVSGSDTGALSSTIAVTFDTTAPASVANTALTRANVGREYRTDLISSEEGTGLVYALDSAPAGATINATTGVITWTPTAQQQGNQQFTLELTDKAGNVRTENITVNVAGEPLAEVKLVARDLQGNVIESVEVGDVFLLELIAVDARQFNQKKGVFGAYTDILFNNSLVRPEQGSSIAYDEDFTLVRKGTFLSGSIDELGAVNSALAATNRAEDLIATVRMEALASGTVNIRTDPADQVDSEFLLYGEDNQIPADSIAFGALTLAIGQTFTVSDDAFSVAEDSGAKSFDVLANDTVVSGSDALSIVSVTQPSSGGTVSVTNDNKVRFIPDNDFNGEAVFTYRVSDSGGVQEDATVTITVTPVNDVPQGENDSLNVFMDTTDNTLDVLANDSFAPDTNETLTITAVSDASQGGTVSISSDGKSILYTPPAGFVGNDSFTYTLSDGGLTDEVTVEVLVAPADDPPTANADAFTVTEDAAEASFDVTANDERDEDDQSFVISAVGTPSQGGTVTINNDGTKINYQPKPNFSGNEEVTYTIQDSGGGIAIGTVTFKVEAVNDPPPVEDKTVSINRATSATTILSISDLPENVDNNETLLFDSVTRTSSVTGGTIQLNSSKTAVVYTPPTGFTGTDTFEYEITDGTSSRTGTITVNVTDFAKRSIEVNLPAGVLGAQIPGITLKGTDALGETVTKTLTYGTDNTAQFEDLLPGEYVIEIPAIPFLQNTETPREILVTSEADDGDTTIDAQIGRLKPEFVSILDFLGSSPRKSILAAVSPGESSTFAVQSSEADTLKETVVELDANGEAVTIRGKRDKSSGTGTDNVTATLPAVDDPRVQVRGEVNGMRLMRISLEDNDINFTVDNSATTAAANAAGTTLAGEASGNGNDTGGGAQSLDDLLAGEGEQLDTNSLLVGESQPEGETIAAAATTQADLFVPVTDDGSSRSDATVLATQQGDLWVGETLHGSGDEGDDGNAVDVAMETVAESLTIASSAGDSLAEKEASKLDAEAVDKMLSDV